MPNPYADPYGNAQTQWRQGGGAMPDPNAPPQPQPPVNSNGAGWTTQQFGATPESMSNGGRIGAPDPNSVAASLNQIMGRQAPQMTAADFSGMGATQAQQLGLLDKMRGYAQGLGPSAAQIGSTMGMGQAAAAGRAGMAGGNALAARAGLNSAMGGMGNVAGQGAQARTEETGQMMGALGKQSQGLANNALGVSSLADLQIQQQQALGLGQAQRNYALGQGMLGTALQEQMDIGKAGMQAYETNKQKQAFDQQQALGYMGAAIPFFGGLMTAGGAYAGAANNGGFQKGSQ